MEISGIRSALPFIFPNGENEGEAARAAQTAQANGDVVDVNIPGLLADDEVEDVLNETISMIGQDRVAALSVHSLSEQRVFALLGI